LLKLELTETTLVDDVDEVIAKMSLLKENGIQFSMGDFGMGYSSLQYLRKLPLDPLKIDQSFVRDLEFDQKDMLIEYGCSNYQGYFFSKPLHIDEVEGLLLAEST